MRLPLLRQAENYACRLLRENLPPARIFHNIDHTTQVVEQSQLLASYYPISEIDENALFVAAWFHDTGYCRANLDHEEESVKIAFEFFEGENLSAGYRSEVQKLIMATKLPAKPATLIEQILCDADMCHLGSIDYEVRSLLLKEEMELVSGQAISDSAWAMQNISFFRSHRYFTDVAKQLWEDQKRRNLFWLLDQ